MAASRPRRVRHVPPVGVQEACHAVPARSVVPKCVRTGATRRGARRVLAGAPARAAARRVASPTAFRLRPASGTASPIIPRVRTWSRSSSKAGQKRNAAWKLPKLRAVRLQLVPAARDIGASLAYALSRVHACHRCTRAADPRPGCILMRRRGGTGGGLVRTRDRPGLILPLPWPCSPTARTDAAGGPPDAHPPLRRARPLPRSRRRRCHRLVAPLPGRASPHRHACRPRPRRRRPSGA